MSVPVENFVWQQGEDLEISLVYNEGPEGEEVPVDLSGHSLRMDVVDGTSGTRIFTFNSDDIAETGVDVVGPNDNEAVLGADGSINITVPRSLTLGEGLILTAMNAGTTLFNYDIFLRDGSNRQHPILRGTITVERSYTLWE